MFGHVVRRDVESLRNLADVERLVEQQSDDADPGVLTERSERDDAVIPVNDGECTVTGRKTVELNETDRTCGVRPWCSEYKVAQTVVGGKLKARQVEARPRPLKATLEGDAGGCSPP